MNDTNTGGSAFPALYAGNGTEGMTLRDYFAAKAMQGVLSGIATRADTFSYSECAGLAYEMADAMLEVRNK